MLWRQEVEFGRSKAQAYRLLAGKNFGDTYTLDGIKRPYSRDELADPSSQEDIARELDIVDDNRLLEQISALIGSDTSSKTIEQTLSDMEGKLIQKNMSDIETPYLDEPTMNYTPVWELDGLFKIYLQRLGSTPYLHIDSELNFRQPGHLAEDDPNRSLQDNNLTQEEASTAFLHSYNFKQLRRIISKQIHYFDHPAFGLIVQLRRYHPPVQEETE